MFEHRGQITVAYLRECFDLDPENGKLFWRVRPASHFSSSKSANMFNNRFAGKEAGCVYRHDGGDRVNHRRKLMVGYHAVQMNRIVYAMFHNIDMGDLPAVIDHIDCNPLNDRPSNLRAATIRQNSYNRRANLKKKLGGAKGAFFDQRVNRWNAGICSNGSHIHLGTFETEAEAKAAYRGAATILHGDFMRTE